MKKRIFALTMAVIILVSLVAGAIPAMAAEDGITIKLHYSREDGNYDGWNVWLWPFGADGVAYNFVEENGEMVATATYPTGTLQIGYIVRYGNWEARDLGYEMDQYIDVTGLLTGTVHYYVKSGVPTQEKDGPIPTLEESIAAGVTVLEDGYKMGVVVTKAKYDQAKNQVAVNVSKKLEYTVDTNTFKVGNDDGEVAVSEVIQLGALYYLVMEEPLDLARGYNLIFEENSYAIDMPDYYSTSDFESKYTYEGNDLGATYSKEKTTLRVWAPTAIDVKVNLYSDGNPATQAAPVEQVQMTKDVNGTWIATLNGDRNGTYYTYLVQTDTETNEACDPYARTTGVNGHRAMIIDLDATDPEGWANDKDPHYDDKITDAVIWELHVRDFSSDPSSGIKNTGKFLGLIETGTKNTYGQSTGLDYLKDLGITHIHLLPSYDYASVDETKLDTPQFNWGYDPANYNVPEGSYSTDPYHGEVRVKEFKQMVKGLHDNGISVVMDVVYNHVYSASSFCYNNIVPDYFSRPSGSGSGCGNDTASERSMVHKYIVESVKYWADEYHIDGFRFDLAGVLDTVTINAIVEEVHKTHPNVIFYGEGWTSGAVQFTKPGMIQAVKDNSSKTPNFAYFSDTIRNELKGGTFGGITAGFISGGNASTATLNACFKGMPSWCKSPTQSINYVSAHDNNTLFDHISLVKPNATYEEKAAMNKLAVAFYMTAQGVPFIHAGEEILRSKPDATKPDGFNENSYNASDAINSIKWDTLGDVLYENVYNYYKGMIAFRKAHPALRLTTAADVNTSVSPASGMEANVVAYQIKGGVNGETAEAIYAIYNANAEAKTVSLPEGEWHICVNAEEAGVYSLGKVSGSVSVDGVSAMILVKGDVAEKPVEDVEEPAGTNWVIVGVVVGIVAVLSAAVVVILLKKKK